MPPRRPDRLRTPVPDPAQKNESIRAENPPSGSRQDIGIPPEKHHIHTSRIGTKQDHAAPGSKAVKCQKKSAPHNTTRKIMIFCEPPPAVDLQGMPADTPQWTYRGVRVGVSAGMTNPDASFVGFVQRPVRAARSVICRFLVLGSECAPHGRTVDLLFRNIVHRNRDAEHGCQCDQVCSHMAIDR